VTPQLLRYDTQTQSVVESDNIIPVRAWHVREIVQPCNDALAVLGGHLGDLWSIVGHLCTSIYISKQLRPTIAAFRTPWLLSRMQVILHVHGLTCSEE
jgi:hypothetical protein